MKGRSRCKTKKNDASVNPISEEEQLIGRRFSVGEERRVEETSPSDDVAEMHKVKCESNWPDK